MISIIPYNILLKELKEKIYKRIGKYRNVFLRLGMGVVV